MAADRASWGIVGITGPGAFTALGTDPLQKRGASDARGTAYSRVPDVCREREH